MKNTIDIQNINIIKHFTRIENRHFLAITAILFILSGCAGSPAGVDIVQPLNSEVNLTQYKFLELIATSDEDILITNSDKERIVGLVQSKINEKNPDRFKFVNGEKLVSPSIKATINIRTYEKGNAFARAMLVGLGQIHIEGDLILEDISTNMILGKFDITKTFAWGGIYGGVTRIEDVEDGFAEAIVAILFEEEQLSEPS